MWRKNTFLAAFFGSVACVSTQHAFAEANTCYYGFEASIELTYANQSKVSMTARSGRFAQEDGTLFGWAPGTSGTSESSPIKINTISFPSVLTAGFGLAARTPDEIGGSQLGRANVVPEVLMVRPSTGLLEVAGRGRENYRPFQSGGIYPGERDKFFAACFASGRRSGECTYDFLALNSTYPVSSQRKLTDLWKVPNPSASGCATPLVPFPSIPPENRPGPDTTCPVATDPTGQVRKEKGNPIRISDLSKIERTTCLTTNAPASPINYWLSYAKPRVLNAAVGQTREPSWRDNYSRKLWLRANVRPSYCPAGDASYACQPVAIYRLETENGENYEFLRSADTQILLFRGLNGDRAIEPRLISSTEVEFKYPDGTSDVFSMPVEVGASVRPGLLLRTLRRDGSQLSFSRTCAGTCDGKNTQFMTITSAPSNRQTKITYNDQGGGNWQPTRVEELGLGALARLATMEYTGGRLSKVTDVAGRVRQYRYDPQGRLWKIFNPLNNPDVLGAAAKSTTVTYQSSVVGNPGFYAVDEEQLISGSRVKVVPIAGNSNYDVEFQESGPSGLAQITRYLRNSDQQLLREYLPNSTSKFREFHYNRLNQLMRAIDPEGRATNYTYDGAGFVRQVQLGASADVEVTEFQRNEFGQPVLTQMGTSQVLPDGRLSFDAVGNLVITPVGAITEYSYNAKGFLTQVVRRNQDKTAAQTTTVEYAPTLINGTAADIGLPTRVILPDGTVSTQSYVEGYPRTLTLDVGGANLTETTIFDARGFLTEATNRRGIRSTYEYANNPSLGQFGNLGQPSAMVFDANGRAVRTTYKRDAMLNTTQVIEDANGLAATTTMEYGAIGLEGDYGLTRLINAENREVLLSYDDLGRISTVEQIAARTSGGLSALIACNGSAITRSDASRRITRNCYTPEGFLSKQILDDGRVAATYNYGGFADGMPRSVLDARGVTTQFVYDLTKPRLLRAIQGASIVNDAGTTTPALGFSTQYQYDGIGRLTRASVLNANGSIFRTVSAQSYDGYGRLLEQLDGAGNATRYSYDANRDFVLRVEVGGNNPNERLTTDMRYDRLGRVLQQIVDPSGKQLSSTNVYASFGERWLPIATRNPRGMETKYQYNVFGGIDRVTDALNNSWNYQTNNLGFMTAMTPPTGAATTYAINKLGETLSLTRDGQVERWDYYADGAQKSYTNFFGKLTNYLYDATGRVTSVDYADTVSDPNGARSDANFSYFPNDLLKSATSSPDGLTAETTNYRYDAANRLIARSRGGRDVSYGYNSDSSLSTLNYWGRTSASYGYGASNENNGLVRSANMFGAATGYSYRSTNALSAVARGSLSSTYAYDSATRLIDLKHATAGNILQQYQYGLDANGNRVRSSETQRNPNNAALTPQAVITSMTYDALDRMIRVEHPAMATAAAMYRDYGYDSVGNRTSERTTVPFNGSDMDTDGIADLVFRERATQNRAMWKLGPQDGVYKIQQGLTNTEQPKPPLDWSFDAIADTNKDGKSEFIWHRYAAAAPAAPNIAVWQMGGGSAAIPNFNTLASGTILKDSAGTEMVAAGFRMKAAADLNNDGSADLIWQSTTITNGHYRIAFWNIGGSNGDVFNNGVFFDAVSAEDQGYKVQGAGDFDRDGQVDLVVLNESTGVARVWYLTQNATAIRSRSTIRGLDGSPIFLGAYKLVNVGDLNKDGSPDLFWQATTGVQPLAAWIMGENDGAQIKQAFFLQAGTANLNLDSSNWEVANGSSYARFVNNLTQSFNLRDQLSTGGAYTYDANGNLLGLPASANTAAMSFSYTAANQLKTTLVNGVTTEYQYDASGNLIRTIKSGVRTDYVLDESTGLPQVLGEITGSNELLYAYGPDGLHAQQRYSNGAALGVEYVLNDGLGSAKGLATGAGSITSATSFDAWGNPRFKVGTSSSGMGFTGEQQFSDGTVHLRARSYLPAIGRFLQRDSFAGFVARPQSLNRYAYVEGNPGNMVDPSGFSAECGCNARKEGKANQLSLEVTNIVSKPGPFFRDTTLGEVIRSGGQHAGGATGGFVGMVAARVPEKTPIARVANGLGVGMAGWQASAGAAGIADGIADGDVRQVTQSANDLSTGLFGIAAGISAKPDSKLGKVGLMIGAGGVGYAAGNSLYSGTPPFLDKLYPIEVQLASKNIRNSADWLSYSAFSTGARAAYGLEYWKRRLSTPFHCPVDMDPFTYRPYEFEDPLAEADSLGETDS